LISLSPNLRMKAAVVAAIVAPAMAGSSFAEWAAQAGKVYKAKEEFTMRAAIFAANVAKIEAHNAGESTFTMAVNDFADLTHEEFRARYVGGFRGAATRKTGTWGQQGAKAQALPATVDWTTKGAVTPIKNQGQCGSCWAFSTTGSVEGISFLKTGTLPSLSEQQLVDCAASTGNMGCQGGLMDDAFQWIINNGGIGSEASYPYVAGDGHCNTSCGPCKKVAAVATITGFTDVKQGDTELATAIVQQPVSVAVDASESFWQFYSGGVMTNKCGTALDHGVLAVGYGTSGANQYWLVKNSWGTSWGAAGFLWLGRGAQYGASGQCGIFLAPSYPTKN
jgi:C1A family cysteine protease